MAASGTGQAPRWPDTLRMLGASPAEADPSTGFRCRTIRKKNRAGWKGERVSMGQAQKNEIVSHTPWSCLCLYAGLFACI